MTSEPNRELSVNNLSVRIFLGKAHLLWQLQIMYIDIVNKWSKTAKSGPRDELKGRTSKTCTPREIIPEDVFYPDNRRPSWRATRMVIGDKKIWPSEIFTREEVMGGLSLQQVWLRLLSTNKIYKFVATWIVQQSNWNYLGSIKKTINWGVFRFDLKKKVFEKEVSWKMWLGYFESLLKPYLVFSC
jgi:hypothetical protein